ncbi:hypothetical protein [Streptomyces sp. MMBL 11-3]|uniref:hypothetical protein n=1 Tax=Streptomyces sp. MMBL 11-3 TaxID=3382639 RepID=UPI0039B558C5
MGTKAENEAGIETGTGARRDDEAADLVKDDRTSAIGEVEEAGAGEADEEVRGDTGEDADAEAGEPATAAAGTGVGLGAAAVVSAALGVVSLTGSWIGTVAQARDSLYGQLETVQGAPVATQVKQVYADSWNANALVAGLFALVALIVGVVVLVRPAFGDPDRLPAQSPWVKSVAWAGVALGVVGLLLAVLKYTDVLLGMPST